MFSDIESGCQFRCNNLYIKIERIAKLTFKENLELS